MHVGYHLNWNTKPWCKVLCSFWILFFIDFRIPIILRNHKRSFFFSQKFLLRQREMVFWIYFYRQNLFGETFLLGIFGWVWQLKPDGEWNCGHVFYMNLLCHINLIPSFSWQKNYWGWFLNLMGLKHST